MVTRRKMTAGLGLALGAAVFGRPAFAADAWPPGLPNAFGRIEAMSGGRLGVGVLDIGSGAQSGHRLDERFPLCSTFKLLAAAAVLTEADRGNVEMTHRIVFNPGDVVANSPVTAARTGGVGMTLTELCAAAIDYSDNTAGNMLLRQIGGPAALTRYARAIGDGVTRLDRPETDLNEALPGDARDTTTPRAMLADLQALVFGSLLAPASRYQLVAWLKGNTTGNARLRAKLPSSWQVGDKTGSGEHGTANDVGIIWIPDRKPILAAVYLTGATVDANERSTVIAAVGQAIAEALPGG